MLNRFFRSSELSSDAYHAEREHESSTNLKSILITPAHYAAQIGKPSQSNDTLQLGSALHAAILEPEEFDARFVVIPKCDRRTSVGKQAYLAYQEQHKGKILIPSEQIDFLNLLRDQIHRHPDVHKMLAIAGENEASIFWTDDETGVKLKVRPDRHFVINNELFYISLKSAANASPEAFSRDVEKYDYHMSEAMYLDGLEQAYGMPAYPLWLVFEKDTWQINKFEPCERTMAVGHERYRRAVKTLKQCRESGEFAGYQRHDETQVISLPERAFRRAALETGITF